MTQKEILKEAVRKRFHRYILRNEYGPQTIIGSIRTELEFYVSRSDKAEYLNQMVAMVNEILAKHREEKHNGQADASCAIEKNAATLLYFIQQEAAIYQPVARWVPAPDQPKKIFVSYSHSDDKKYIEGLVKNFAAVRKHIDLWVDTKLEGGVKWRKEIEKQISESKVGILLISTNFLGSDFILNEELPRLLKNAEDEGFLLLVLFIDECLIEMLPDVLEFQAMNSPRQPLDSMAEKELQGVYLSVVRRAMSELGSMP